MIQITLIEQLKEKLEIKSISAFFICRKLSLCDCPHGNKSFLVI